MVCLMKSFAFPFQKGFSFSEDIEDIWCTKKLRNKESILFIDRKISGCMLRISGMR